MSPACPVCGAEVAVRHRSFRTEVVCRNPECTFEVAPSDEDMARAAIATFERSQEVAA